MTVITPWVNIIKKRLGPGDFSLSMTDRSTSEGWSKKSNFIEEERTQSKQQSESKCQE